MFPEFRGNLLRTKGEPPKTQTIRNWSQGRLEEHEKSYREGRWIRVWRGQGNKATIGWLLITSMDEIKVIDKGDCIREGRPLWEPAEFKRLYFPDVYKRLTRVQFLFRACRACLLA